MRLFAVTALIAALAAPAAAQTPVAEQAGFKLAVDACRQIVEGAGAPSAVGGAKTGSGLATAPTGETANLQAYFFKDVARVDWWRRPTRAGRVYVGYDSAANKCRAFLLGAPRGPVIAETLDALPAGWFAQEAGKTFVRRRDDGSLTVMTLLPGDESKGIGPDSLTVMGLVWIIPPDDEES